MTFIFYTNFYILRIEKFLASSSCMHSGRCPELWGNSAKPSQKNRLYMYSSYMGQNLDVLLLYKGHSDLGLVGFAQLLDPLFSGTFDDITF